MFIEVGNSFKGSSAFFQLVVLLRDATDTTTLYYIGARAKATSPPDQISDLAKLDLLESINSMRPLLLSHVDALRITEDIVDLWIKNARAEVKDPRFGCSRKVR